MPVKIAPPLVMTGDQRAALGAMARSTSLPHRKVTQAKALLLAADGVPNNEVARRCGTTCESVRAWRNRFADKGVGVIAKGRGRKPWLPEGTVAEVVRLTQNETRDDTSTHWSTRSLADRPRHRQGLGRQDLAGQQPQALEGRHLQAVQRPLLRGEAH